MKPSAKTIQIFLPSGDPQGIRIAEVTTRIVQVIEVPRSLLQDFMKMPECDQVALYFLFGESEDGSQQKVYIGQTGSPSTAAVALMGRTANGWKEWKNKDGKTLDAVKRQSVSGSL